MSIHATSTEIYTGKNLYNPTISPTTAYGVTGVGTVNGFTLNGTANANGYRLGFNSATLPAGTYTVTVYYDSGTHSGGNIPFILYKTGTWTSVTTFYAMNFSPDSTPGSRTTTFTLSEETEVTLYVYFGTDPTFPTFTDFKCRVQVEAGSTATSYEPYVGGAPSPLVKGVAHVSTSKNLLNMQSDSNGEYLGTTSQKTYSGKNILNVSSQYTISSSDIFKTVAITARNGVLYRVSCSNISTNGSGSCRIGFNNAGGTNVGTVWLSDSAKTQTVTLTGDAVSVYIYSDTNYVASQSATTTYTDLMISEASTTSDYEPYVGGVPSPNPDYPQEIVTGKLKSKNLFALGKTNGTISGVSYTYNSDGTFSLSGTANAGFGVKSAPIPISESGLIPGQKYSFWCDHNVGWGSNSCVYYVQSCDSSGTWIANLMTFTKSGGTATIPSTTAQYVMFVAAGNNGSSYSSYNNVKAQLVAGEQADNVFEPYFAPIELAQIGSYQDKVYKSGGNWRIETRNSKMLLDGSQTWTVGTGTNAYWTALAGSNDYNPIQTTMSDQFVGIAYNDRGNTPPNIMYRDNQTLTIRNTSFASASAATSWFTSNPATVYYLLATPTDTAITDSATILWLNKYDTNALPHHKYVNTRRTTYVGASGLASAIDLYDGSYASTLPTYADANDHHLTTANGGTYTVSLQNISAKIVSGTVTFSVFTNQRKIDFSWNGSATSTSVSVSLQADEYIKSIYAYIPQNADAGITLSQQLESGSLTDFEPYYNIVKIYAGDDLVFEDTSLTD